MVIGPMLAITRSVAAGWLFGLSWSMLVSLAPWSATTGVSTAIAAQISGIPAVTAALTILTGISGALIGGYVLNAMRAADLIVRRFRT
jgi:putative effector of murein hydrolase